MKRNTLDWLIKILSDGNIYDNILATNYYTLLDIYSNDIELFKKIADKTKDKLLISNIIFILISCRDEELLITYKKLIDCNDIYNYISSYEHGKFSYVRHIKHTDEWYKNNRFEEITYVFTTLFKIFDTDWKNELINLYLEYDDKINIIKWLIDNNYIDREKLNLNEYSVEIKELLLTY